MSSDRRVRSMAVREYNTRSKKRKRSTSSARDSSHGEIKFWTRSRTVVDEFRPGNVVEIELHNFMTFSHLKSRPGARLNLVIGPNGTGKSSLVCAIALGLAGEPSLFGRAMSIGDYVKRGEETGWIRITLQDQSSGKYISITRKINTQNQSEWLFEENNVCHLGASKKDIQEIVSRFNIQVNNLTQFLPQDRVSEFAKMTPIQLLEETEKAVGDPELWRQHLFLTKKIVDLKRIKMTITQRETVLASLEATNADLEKDVKRLQKRKSLLQKAENLKKKVPWLKYEQKKALFQVSKRKEKEAKQRLNEASERSKTLKRPLEEMRKKKSEMETAVRRLQQAHDQFGSRWQTSIGNENKMGELVRVKSKEIAEVQRVRQERLATASKDLASVEAELANLPHYEPPGQEIQDIGKQIREFELGIAEKRNQRVEKEQNRFHKRQQRERVVRRIAELQVESTKNRLLRALRDSGARGIVDACKWVERHRTKFQKHVYGPLLLEINIANREHAKYVENHVPSYIWQAFVTQDDQDRDYLQCNLKTFEAVVINARGLSVRNAPRLTRQMKEMGIVARLDEVVSAPPVIKHVLNEHAQLDYSFIGTSQTNACVDQAFALGVNDMWTPENHYRWNRLLDGSKGSASVTAVRASRLLSNVNAWLKNELEDQKKEFEREISHIEQEIAQLIKDFRTLEEEAATLHKHREEIFNIVKLRRKKRDDITSRIEQRGRRLDSLIHLGDDCRTAEERLYAEIYKLNHERKKNVLTLKDLVKESARNQIQLIFEQLALADMDVKVRDLERKIRSEARVALQAQRSYNHSMMETIRSRDLLEEAKKDAEQVATITNELQDMFREMPDTVEDLEGAINDALAKANAVLCYNPGVLEEYERQCKQIEDLEVELDSGRSKLRACLSEIESVKAKWLPTLRTLVAKINEAFGHNLREMAGEVSLDEHGMEFGQYGILIKVKFRETGEMQMLSAHHQSGGERSVSTILYLVSLQDLTHCPFRVVDEINEGMDPEKERKMFQQLVRAASQLNAPQCFLLTPKLLPNVEYTEACSILNVMNGPYIADAAERWKDGPSWATLI